MMNQVRDFASRVKSGEIAFDPQTTLFFFYHDGHPSTAVHRIVGQKLFEEIAARPPAAR